MSGPRYSIIPGDALSDPNVKDSHLRVLAVLGTHTDRNGWCQVNQKSIAERVCKSRETVNRTIRDLCSLGYLRKEDRWSRNEGRTISRYQVLMDRPDRVQDIPTPCDAHVTTPVTSRDHNPCDAQTSQPNDPFLNDQDITSETEISDNMKPSRKRKPYPEAFQAAWSEYPTDPLMSKKKAFEAWQRLDREDQNKVTATIPAFRDYCRKNPSYRPVHMVRFITDRRFDGFAAAAKPSNPAEMWGKRLNYARANRRWATAEWGPMPGKEGCKVPSSMQQKGDGFGWAEWSRETA